MSLHMISNVLLTLFGWPGGILLGNLIASLFWVPIQWLGLHLKLAAHNGAVHERFNELEALLRACPDCGHPRSEADLLPSMPAPSIVVASKDTEA